MVTQDSDILWQLEGLGFSYGSQPVLLAMDLTLHAGHCYGILGPNGCGKTTLLDLLCGLLRPTRGSISLAGQPMESWQPARLARKVAMVQQSFAVRFDFTVREIVAMGRHPHLARFASPGLEDNKVVEAAMEAMDITPFADRPVTRLSGGEQQRVAVARALAQQPEVLLLDEATSNLDVAHSLSILATLKNRVEKQGLTVVAALHDLNQAAFFCDRLIFMKNGQLVCHGPLDEVLTDAVISDVYGVAAHVGIDNFSGCRQVSFKVGE